MPNEILIPLQSLISCFLETPLEQASGSGRNWGTLERLILSMSQRLHSLVNPRSCHPGLGVLLSLIFFVPRIKPMKTERRSGIQQIFWQAMKGIPWHAFSTAFFLLFLSSSLLGLEPGQNPRCLASGPNKNQALMSHCKNSVRDTAIGKRWIC